MDVNKHSTVPEQRTGGVSTTWAVQKAEGLE